MKKMLVVALALTFTASLAGVDHLDVIEISLKEGCTIKDYLAITKDFNDNWAKQYGYKAELVVPIQSHKLDSFFWVGRSTDTATFGKAWDAWRDELGDPNSMASKLSARFGECGTLHARRGHDAYSTD